MLFSSFTAGILAFSKELGSELTSITFGSEQHYIRRLEELILVAAAKDDVSEDRINLLFKTIGEEESFHRLAKSAREAMIITDELLQQFDESVQRFLEAHKLVSSVQEQQLLEDHSRQMNEETAKVVQAILDDMTSGKGSPEKIARALFGLELKRHDENLTRCIVAELRELVELSEISATLRTSLQTLINYLENKWFKAASQASKALF